MTPWPWDAKWWKPKNTRRDLVRAGALIVAELERMDRESKATSSAPGERLREPVQSHVTSPLPEGAGEKQPGGVEA